MAVWRNGRVRAVPVESDSKKPAFPHIDQYVDKDAHLMTDDHHVYRAIGSNFSGHSWVNRSPKEFARGNFHNNTAESFGAFYAPVSS